MYLQHIHYIVTSHVGVPSARDFCPIYSKVALSAEPDIKNGPLEYSGQ